MGMWAEDYEIDAIIDETMRDQETIKRLDLCKSGKWITKDGETIDIKKMSDFHIKNTIAFLFKNISKFDFADIHIKAFEKELSSRIGREVI